MADQKDEKTPGRRQVLQLLAGGVGAGLAAPALAAAEGHVHAPAAPQAPTAPAAEAAAGFLEPNRLETLTSLAEAIVPGSTNAGVAPFVDRLLAVDTRERQTEFLVALGTIDAEARTRFGQPWLGLDAGERTALLTALSTGPRAKTARYWKRGEPVVVPDPPKAPPTPRDRFDLLKAKIAAAYYSSEQGMRELGFTGQMVHVEFPGCTHKGGHAGS